MYRKITQPRNLFFLSQLVEKLPSLIGEEKDSQAFAVCYGSLVTNQEDPQSDVDLLYISPRFGKPIRKGLHYGGRPISVYVLSLLEFTADGDEYRYGGYFSGKTLNPHVVFPGQQEQIEHVQCTSAKFIAPFAAQMAAAADRLTATREDIVRDVWTAYLRLCPWYDAYLLRRFTSPIFTPIWEIMLQHIPTSLCKVGALEQISDSQFRYQRILSAEKLNRLYVSSIARFWAFGACSHSADPGFPDWYFDKSERYMAQEHVRPAAANFMKYLYGDRN